MPSPAKERRPSHSLNKNNSRLGKQEAFEAAAEGVVPSNTRSSAKWAQKMKQRNEKVPDEAIPTDILESVCRVMRLFVLEAWRADGRAYPLTSCDLY